MNSTLSLKHKSVQPIILFQNMIEAPQVQSILNSKYISEKDAKVIISKFLAEQKKYLEDAAVETTNVIPSGDDDADGDADGDGDATVGEENAYDMMDDDDNVVGFEEVQSRLGGILRSLSGIKKEQPVEYNITAASVAVSPVDDQAVDSITPLAAASAAASEASIADSVVSAESESNVPMNDVDASTPQKKVDKTQRKAEKEAKKSVKKAEKEAKKSAKKAKKEAKKERKLKRKSSGGSSSAAKKMKREE